MQVLDQVLEEEAREKKEEMRRLAFLGWLIQAPHLPEGMTFGEFLDGLGLGERPRHVSKEEAMAIGDEIIERMRQQERQAREAGEARRGG